MKRSEFTWQVIRTIQAAESDFTDLYYRLGIPTATLLATEEGTVLKARLEQKAEQYMAVTNAACALFMTGRLDKAVFAGSMIPTIEQIVNGKGIAGWTDPTAYTCIYEAAAYIGVAQNADSTEEDGGTDTVREQPEE